MIPFAFTFELKDILLILIGLFLGLFFSFFKKDYRQKREKKISDDLAYIKGINYVISNEPDRAIEELIKVVKFNPETVSAYIMLGNLFRSQGEYERAIRIHQSIVLREDLDQRIKLQAMFDLSLDFKKAGLFNRAIDSFKEVIKFSSDNIEAFIHLEDIYEEVRDWEKAFKIRQKIASLRNSKEEEVLAHLLTEHGKEKQALGKRDDAKKYFENAIKYDEKCIDAWLNLGDLYFLKGEIEKAIYAWEKVIIFSPPLTFDIFSRIKKALFNKDDDEKIFRFLEDMTKKYPENPYLKVILGKKLLDIGKNEKAVEQFLQAKKIKPNLKEARESLIKSYQAMGKLEEAIKEIKDMFSLFKENEYKYQCRVCGYETSQIIWKCPQCRRWGTIQEKDE